ncbi:hypothetical protein WA158_001325 [Blastocystis sp. Blastoise]
MRLKILNMNPMRILIKVNNVSFPFILFLIYIVVLPTCDLNTLTQMQVQWPLCFSIRFDKYQTCGGVLEFSAPDNICYIPTWMYKKLRITSDGMIIVTNISPPKATFIKLKPNTYEFLNLSNPKAVLEHILVTYTVAQKNDYYQISYNNKNYILQIIDLKPANICSIVETDVEIEFEEADNTPKYTPQSTPTGSTPSSPMPPSMTGAISDIDTHFTEQNEESEEHKKRPISRFAKPSFTWESVGSGQRLDGKPISHSLSTATNGNNTNNATITSSSTGNTLGSSQNRGTMSSRLLKKPLNVFEQKKREEAFKGNGHTLK